LGRCRAMMMAQIAKTASQQSGSIFQGITNTVASAMAKPNSDKPKISFQSIVPSLIRGGPAWDIPDTEAWAERSLVVRKTGARRGPRASAARNLTLPLISSLQGPEAHSLECE